MMWRDQGHYVWQGSRNRTLKRLAALGAALILVCSFLAGCGRDSSVGSIGTDGTGVDGSSAADGDGNAQGAVPTGRYVEKRVELNDSSLSDWKSRLFTQEDGSLLLVEDSGLVLRSWDNGGSWIREELPGFSRITKEGNLVMCTAIGRDRTIAFLWMEPEWMESEETEEQEEAGAEGSEESKDQFTPEFDIKLLIVRPDDTEITADIKLTKEDGSLKGVHISDTGRIFVSTMSSTLYEVKEDGSSEVFLTVDEGTPELIRFQGDLMFMDGNGYEAPLIYDIEEKKYIEDEVLTAFVAEHYGDRDSYFGQNYDLFLFSGGEDVIYTAGAEGVYRHVLGGAAMEQVIDGNLSIFGNPAYSIMDMLVVGDNEFLVLLWGGKIVRYVYDPDIPTVPAGRLKVYSLEEKATIRQAINLYQTSNPEIYVDYEVGLDKNSSVTRDDALKNLSARIMAGEGPDILVMDNMPIDSYIEKGLLADISPVIDGMSGEDALFPNVAELFRQDGHVYTMPCEIQLPFILGRISDLDKMTDLSGIADAMEDMREEYPGDDLIRVTSAKGIMRIFSMASVPVWRTESGGIDREALAEFLTQTKRIYDAQMDGLPEETARDWDYLSQYYLSVYGERLEDLDEIRTNGEEIYFMGDRRKFSEGSVKNIDHYTRQVSVIATDGFEDCETIPMAGQCSNVFWAKTMLSISVMSENIELAQDFLKTALGKEGQANVQDGIPVNRQAILDDYADQRRIYEGNGYISGSSCLGDSEGNIQAELLIRVPDEATVDHLLQWIESMDTVYVENDTLESVVYEEGMVYMRDERSLEETMDAIEKKLAIWLAGG